jgi:CheY-like chemotaxis protein/HPt (histidine-containing phosphotransfer) domain-containing protein
VDDIVQMLAHSAQAKGVALSGSVSADLPALVRGDAVRISQVLTNLVGNAVKFSERGEVKIRAELQSQTASTILIRLTVQDNGVGISEEGQERLFQPFSQADASTARKFGGTGLGLAISKRIVELMGGTIGVDSKLGEGSTFWFTVPLERAALAGQASALQPLPAHEVRASEELQAFRAAVVSDGSKNRRILLAEDNPTNQMLTYYQLERLGYSVDIVSDGRQALEALARAPYDLVFMDCQMPELDGYQAAAEIRKSEGTTKHTPIVAMTAHVLEGEAAKCRDAGMDGYVAKPVTMDALKNVLRHWAGYTIETGDQPAASPTDLSVPVNMSIPLEATEGNPEALRRLVSTYISQTTSHLKDLERAIQANLPEDVKRIAHALAGSSDCFGAVLLVPTLREMERLGKERQLAKAPALWVKAMEDFEQVKRFLTVSANLESASAGGPADRDDHPS